MASSRCVDGAAMLLLLLLLSASLTAFVTASVHREVGDMTPPSAAPASRPRVQRFATPHGSERVESLDIVTGVPYRFQLVYELELRDVEVGHIVQVTAQFEATNPYSTNVMLAHFLSINGTSQHIPPAYPAGENITPGMHHSYRSLAGTFVVQADHLVRRPATGEEAESGVVVPVQLWAYAACDLAGTDWKLVVEHGYGGLTALVFAP